MNTPQTRKPLTGAQKFVLGCAFLPMVATGVVGGIGTYSNIGHAYGKGTALGASPPARARRPFWRWSCWD